MSDIKELIDFCKNTDKSVFIQTHNFPDADAIASAYALGELLGYYNIACKFCCAGQIDRISTSKLVDYLDIRLYQEDELPGIMDDKDHIICVDSQKNAGNIADFIGDEIACIDHHPTFVDAQYKWKQVEIVGACSTLLTEHFNALGLTPTEKCATALMYGIKMDTLHFSRGVTDRDISAFSYLFGRVDADALRKLETNNLESKDLQAYSAVIKNIHLYGDVGFSKIDFPCTNGLIAILSEFILSLEEVNVAVIYSFREDGIKLSVRSMAADVDAGVLAHKALDGVGNGGGHAAMAGGFIPNSSIKGLEPYVDSAVEKLFLKHLQKHIC